MLADGRVALSREYSFSKLKIMTDLGVFYTTNLQATLPLRFRHVGKWACGSEYSFFNNNILALDMHTHIPTTALQTCWQMGAWL